MKNVALPLVAAALVLAGGGTFWWIASGGSGDHAAARATVAAAAAPASAGAKPTAEHADELQRDAVAAALPAAAPRIRVLRADGQPAAGLEYWTWPSLPAWAVVTTDSFPAPIELPECRGRTDAAGDVAAPPGQPLSVRVIDGILVTWPSPPAAVHLPPLAEIGIALVDAPPLPHWEAFLHPWLRRSDAWVSQHEMVVSRTTMDGEVLIAVHSQHITVEGRTSATLPALPGVEYTAGAIGLGFRVGDHGNERVLAPGSATLRCEGPEPTLRIRALAADGATPLRAAMSAHMETEHVGDLEESTTGEIRCRAFLGDMTVTTEVGEEVFTASVHPGKEGETCLDCVAGRGRKPWRLGPRAGEEIHELWWRRGTGDWQQGELYMCAAPCLLEHKDRLDMHGLEPAGARVWLLAETGRVLEASDGGTGRWLPTTEVVLLDRALTGASAREWSAQLLLPDSPREHWATFARFQPDSTADKGGVARGRSFEVPVGCSLRLLAHTENGDVAVPWPR